MADNSATFNLNVTSNGTTDKETKLAKNLNNELEKASKNAARVPKAVAAARQGVDNTRDSGTARGIGGQTGAEGRDFAKQASGLGGLVHVYATFAANLFAISAGFQALSKAANVTNMVKGLDQLGAASGRNLGSIAKQLSMVADGAVSLQEAMSATAQASSAGMSSTNILRMGEVAKKASQALGRDMTDALSRLSRGITKIEPELLDELGIMVKVDQATQNYARTLGKSASSLTDFEKRQAFANEVLSQAEQKFGNINLDANPYQKILASIQNLTQSGLELVNKVLGPIMSALSQSPTALAGVLAGLGTILLKQAIPAISSFRENLSKAADQADAAKASIASRRKAAYDEQDAVKLLSLYDKQKDSLDKLTKAKDEYLAVGKGKNLKATLGGLDATASNLSAETVAKEAHTRELGINNAMRKKGIDLTGEAIKQANLEKQAILNVTKASNELLEVRKHLEVELAKSEASDSFTRKANQAVIDKANARAMQSRIVSNTAENFVSIGPITALKALYKEVQNATKGLDAAGKPFVDGTKKMSGFAAATTFAKASVSGFAASTMLMASALSNVFMVVGLVITAFSLLSSWATKSAKEAETFSTSTDMVNSSVEGLKNTLDNINSKSLDNAIKTESMQARATAIQELSDALSKQAKDFDTLVTSMNGFDKGWDSVKAFYYDLGSVGKIAYSTKASITQMLGSFSNIKQVEKFRSLLGEIYGVSDTSGSNIEKVINTLSREEAASKARQLADAWAKVSREINNAIAPATAFELALTEAAKVASDLTTSLKLTDPFSKLGMSLLGLGQLLDKAMEHPLESISSVIKLMENPQLAGLFPTDKIESIVKSKKELVALSKEQKQYDDAVLAAEKLKSELQDKQAKGSSKIEVTGAFSLAAAMGNKVRDSFGTDYTSQISAVAKEITRLKGSSEEISAKAVAAVKKINDELLKPTLFNKAIENLNVGLKNAFAQAGLAGAKALNSAVGSLGVDTSVADAELAKREIGLRVAEIEARGSFLKAQIENTLQMKELTLSEERLALEVAFNSKMGRLSIEEIAKYSQDKKDNDKAKDALKAGRSLLSSNGLPKQTDNKVAIGAIGIDNYAAILGLNAQKAQAAAEGPAAKLKGIIAVAKESYVLEGKKLDVQIQENKQQLDSLSTASSIASVNSIDYATKVASLEKDKLRLTYEKDTLAERGTLAAIEKSLASGLLDAKNKEATKAQELLVLASLSAKQKQYSTNLTQLEYDTYVKLYDISALLKQNEIDSNRRIYDTRVQLVQELLSLEEKRISIAEGYGLYSESEIAAKKSAVSETRQQLDNESALLTVTRAQDDARTSMLDKITKLRAAAFNEDGSTKNTEALSNLNAQLAEYSKLKTEQAQILDLTISSNAAKLAGTKLLADQAKEQARINDLTKDLVSFGDSLTAVFGKAGTAIGELAKNTILFTDQTAKYNEERKKLESVTNDNTTSIDSKQEAFKQLADLDNKHAKDTQNNELKNIALTKSVFKEKTAAYKILAGVEKAMHIAKLAMTVKEVVTEIMGIGTVTTASVAAEGPKATAKVPGIFAEFGAQMGPWGWAAAAAFVAAIGLGGKGSGPKAGFTAEDRQKVNGTGQNYDSNGKIVNTGLGILGNESAKNETVTKGIELISKNSFTGLEFSNKMLDALKAIKDNTGALGKSILSISGIRVKTDAVTGGNWVTGKTSTDIKDAGIAISGTIGDIKKGIVGLSTYINSTSKDSGLFGTGLFGGSSSNTKVDPITDKKMKGQVAAIFSSVSDALVEAGKSMGNDAVSAIIDGMDVTKAFDKVSTLGLTGQEAVDALVSQIGLVMDEASQAAFPQLTKFQTMGESFSDTVVRVADDSRVVTKAFESIGLALPKLSETTAEIPSKLIDAVTAAQKKVEEAKAATQKDSIVHGQSWTGGESGYMQDYTAIVKGSEQATHDLMVAEEELQKARNDITNLTVSSTTKNLDVIEALIKKAGGLDNFVSKVDFFKNNFLTEAERLDPIQKAVTAEMTRLGLASIKTRAEFKKLVLGIDTTTSTGQDLYTSLMNVQEGFSMVYKDIAESTKLEQELLSALGFTYDALLLQRKEELSTLSESDRVMKERIYAVQDANKTEALNQELLDATGRSTESLLAKRKQELRGLSSTDAALKTRIWLLQDEKKLLDAKIAQEVKIYGLLGKSEEALRLTRAQELLAIDPQLAASQLYIYALEDEASLKDKLKAAYDKESSSLKDTISRTKDFIKTLKDYRDSLVLGDNSILTPAQKYAEAKRQFLQVSAIATNIAITDAQKQAQSEAISKLPGISDAFLTASKNIYASSDAYTSDFNSVLDILDKTSTALDAQQTDAQKTLDALDKQTTIQQLIADNTESSAVILQKLLDAMAATEAARAGAAAAGSAAAGGGFTAPTGVPVNNSAFIDPTGTGWIHGADGYTGTFAEGKQFIFDSLAAIDAGTLKASELVDQVVKQGITSTMLDSILGEKAGTSSAWALAHGITGFANGGTPKGLSMVGEQGPELVDFKTPARVYSNGQTNSMFGTNQELLQELKLLREEVAQLRAEQHEQTGNLIKFNYDANTMAADKIANAQANAANSAEWNRRNQPKIM